jgi:hypothetical protein
MAASGLRVVAAFLSRSAAANQKPNGSSPCIRIAGLFVEPLRSFATLFQRSSRGTVVRNIINDQSMLIYPTRSAAQEMADRLNADPANDDGTVYRVLVRQLGGAIIQAFDCDGLFLGNL